MERFNNIKTWFPFVVSLLFILLFVYAAVSKLVDYQNFRVQLGQSPLLTAFAHWVAWAVPTVELIIAGMLFFPRLRLLGLYGCFTLMVMFTAYIVIILNFTDYIPCSCGGVLEDLGWTEHLIFNIGFVLLALIAILLKKPQINNITKTNKKTIGTLVGLSSLSIGIIVALFLNLEKTNHERNDFVRRFSEDVIKLDKQMDLDLNSYYFSGVDNDFIYLGNVTAPLRLTLVSTDLSQKEEVLLSMDYMDYPFRSLKTVVVPPYFYLYDGTVPCLYKGNIGEWVARKQTEPPTTFSKLVAMGSDRFAVRTIIANPRRHALGILDYGHDTVVHRRFEDGITSHGYGIFDGDGTLAYNAVLDQAVYTLYYRNQYIHYTDRVDSMFRGKTIDSISQARMKVTELKDGSIKMDKPPKFVNQYTSTMGRYLLVRSKIMGLMEPTDMWDKAAIIDVYDLSERIYKFSFYIQNVNKNFTREFIGQGNKLYSLADQYLTSYAIELDQFRYQ